MEQQWTQVTTWEILVRYEVIVVVFTFYLLLWLFFKLLLFLFIYFAGGSNTGPDCPEKLFHSVIGIVTARNFRYSIFQNFIPTS